MATCFYPCLVMYKGVSNSIFWFWHSHRSHGLGNALQQDCSQDVLWTAYWHTEEVWCFPICMYTWQVLSLLWPWLTPQIEVFRLDGWFAGQEDDDLERQMDRILQILSEFSADPILCDYVIDALWDKCQAMKVFSECAFHTWKHEIHESVFDHHGRSGLHIREYGP
jgi:hypothetical protein